MQVPSMSECIWVIDWVPCFTPTLMCISSCLQVIAGINNNEIMKGIDKNYHLYFEPVLGATFYIQCHVFIYNNNNDNQNRRVISFLFRPAVASCMIIKQQPVHIRLDVGLI